MNRTSSSSDPTGGLHGSRNRRRALRPWVVRRLGLRLLLCLALAWGAYAAVQGDGADPAPASADSEPSAAEQESEELGTFVPSEEVGAEQGVAFPVDI